VPVEANLDPTQEPVVAVQPASSATWAACGVRDSKYKKVKEYGRQMMAGFSGSSAHLDCGTFENWGYRHIKAGTWLSGSRKQIM
jgi:hypothetical protein